jgi:hypothetical protein
MERRLAAILAADFVGYSPLIEANEVGTLTVLKARRKTAPARDSSPLRVNRVDFAMSATGPLTPQLLPIWCSAANRRDVPTTDD